MSSRPKNTENPLKEDRHGLQKAATNFVNRLKSLHSPVGERFLAVVYFDEAHTLHTDEAHTLHTDEAHTLHTDGAHNFRTLSQSYVRNPYFALMHAMSCIVNEAIFFCIPVYKRQPLFICPHGC
jgi:hypothetical protein